MNEIKTDISFQTLMLGRYRIWVSLLLYVPAFILLGVTWNVAVGNQVENPGEDLAGDEHEAEEIAFNSENEKKYIFSISPGSVFSSMIAVAGKANISILVDQGVQDVKINGLNGYYSPNDAVKKLLDGTGLIFSESENGIVILRAEVGTTKEGTSEAASSAINIESKLASEIVDQALEVQGRSFSDLEPKLEEIIVTSARRTQSLQKVPLSVTVFSQDALEVQGSKQMDDLTRYTPSLVITRNRGTENQVSIRGIFSNAGSATTGIYIDETPIQVRNLPFAGTSFPLLFDMERVEILRGPQGTLFGAGSEGGTVRFIRKSPSINQQSSIVQAEYSAMTTGDPSYDIGAAYGAPLIEGSLGFRASAYTRFDGGYIDGIQGTPVILDASGDAGPKSLTFIDKVILRKNTNSHRSTALRAALEWAPTSKISLTPTLSYQKQERHDGTGHFLPAASSKNGLARLVYDAGNPTQYPHLSKLNEPNTESAYDEFYLYSLESSWDLGQAMLFTNTSYLDREALAYRDFTGFYTWFYDFADPANGFLPRKGDKAVFSSVVEQRNFVQEFRLQSKDNNQKVDWLAGFFFGNFEQIGNQSIPVNFLAYAPSIGTVFSDPLKAVNGGVPFGQGSTAFENWFGVSPTPDSLIWGSNNSSVDTQLAVFSQIDVHLSPRVTLTAGLRYSLNKLDMISTYRGAENNQSSPFGEVTIPPIDPYYSDVQGANREVSTTPKLGVTFNVDDNNMIYANISKGFRPAGVTKQLPTTLCEREMVELGYVDTNGRAKQPTKFTSDYVWSYEIGSKNSFWGNRLSIDASLYHIKWVDIQTNVSIIDCAESFTTNLGEVSSDGFDISFQFFPIASLKILGTITFNDARFNEDALSPGGKRIATKNFSVPNSQAPWTYFGSAQYEFEALDRALFFRADVSYNSKERPEGKSDPKDRNYSRGLEPIKAYAITNIRMGTYLEDSIVSIFVKNLTNEQPSLSPDNSSAYLGYERFAWTDRSITPRTYGISISYKF